MTLDPNKLHELASEIQQAEQADAAAAAAFKQTGEAVNALNVRYYDALAELKKTSTEALTRANADHEKAIAFVSKSAVNLDAKREALKQYISTGG